MPPLTSPSGCNSCLRLTQKILEFEGRVPILYHLKDEEQTLWSPWVHCHHRNHQRPGLDCPCCPVWRPLDQARSQALGPSVRSTPCQIYGFLKINSPNIKRLMEDKYIGFWLDDRSIFKYHIRNLVGKFNQKISFLWGIKPAALWFVGRGLLKQLSYQFWIMRM